MSETNNNLFSTLFCIRNFLILFSSFFYANLFYSGAGDPSRVHENCDENNEKNVKIYPSNNATSLRTIFLKFIRNIKLVGKNHISRFFRNEASTQSLHVKRQDAWIYVKISQSKVKESVSGVVHRLLTQLVLIRLLFCCGKYCRISKDLKEWRKKETIDRLHFSAFYVFVHMRNVFSLRISYDGISLFHFIPAALRKKDSKIVKWFAISFVRSLVGISSNFSLHCICFQTKPLWLCFSVCVWVCVCTRTIKCTVISPSIVVFTS